MLVVGVRGSALVKTRNLRGAVELEAEVLHHRATGLAESREQEDALLTVLRQGGLVSMPFDLGAKCIYQIVAQNTMRSYRMN